MKAENWFQLRIVGVAAIGVGQLDPERANINDCAVNGVLRRDSSIGVGQLDRERGNVNDCAIDEVLRRHRRSRLGGRT